MSIGRAGPWLVVGLVGALVLMAVSVFVAISWRPSAPTPVPSEDVARCDDVEPPPGADDERVFVYLMCEPPPADPRPVVREAPGVAQGADSVRFALQQLLAGPTQAEREAGISTVFPAGSEALLIGVELHDGLAVIDFADALRDAGPLNASTPRFMVFATLGATIFQFEEIDAIEYRIEGSCLEFARHFETTCQPWLRDG